MPKKYHIITYGCQMNKSDSERIAAFLENIGYRRSLKMNGANLIVVNMCSVRQPAVDRVFGLKEKLSKIKTEFPTTKEKENKKAFSSQGDGELKIILTGCFLEKDKRKLAQIFDFVLSLKELSKWPQYLKIKGKNLKTKNYFDFPAKYANSSSVLIPISSGCNNFCSYCVVPNTRGRLICRKDREILKEAKKAIEKGAKEIWLLGQNVNDYRSREENRKSGLRTAESRINSKTTDFTKLIKAINSLPGRFKFFFVSPHPKNFSDELIEALAQCRKFGKYLNLPLQSGSDKILKKMNRNYSSREYEKLIKKMREKIPQINLSTDIIVGFPGETKADFQKTVNLFKKIKFNSAYISKYSPRPETAAFEMKDDISWKEKKQREKILRGILK